MNTAFRSLLFDKDHSTLRAWLLALAINLVFVNLLDQLRVITITIAPFFWPAAIIGGLLFGIGMVFAGGCTSGTWYRASKGMLGSFGALLGFAIGATTLTTGVLRPVMDIFRRPVIDSYGEDLSIVHLLPLDPLISRWIFVAIFLAAILVYLLKAPKQTFVIGWRWQTTGIVIGVLAVLGWLASSFSNRDYGLSITQPTISLVRLILLGDDGGINWATFFLLGLPLGAGTAAALAGDFSLRLPSPSRFLQQFAGGLLMGLGAALAGGCNIGHGITGLSALSITSVVATAFTVFGCWGITGVIYRRVKTP